MHHRQVTEYFGIIITFPVRLKAPTVYYYPGHWIHFNAALTVHNFHFLGNIPCLELPLRHCYNGDGKLKHNHLSPPTGSPFIHLG